MSPHLGCYGDPDAITPNLDRLAKDGVCFRSAFTVAGVCAPSRTGIITGMYPTTLGAQHMRSKVILPEHIKCFPTYLRRANYWCTNNAKTDYNFQWKESEVWDECGRNAHWRHRKSDQQSFFAVFNIELTHESRINFDEAYPQVKMMLAPAEQRDPTKLTLPPYYPDTPLVRRNWARYYNAITAMDKKVGELLAQLAQDKLTEDTIVFFWSDHGAGLPRAKRWLYDSGTRVPLIVRVPAKFRVDSQAAPGSTDDRLISFIDLAPTVLRLAGVPLPDHFQGQPFLGTDLPAPRTYVFGARDRMDERYDIIRSVRDKRYRYIRNYQPYKPYYQWVSYGERSAVMQELRQLHAKNKLPPAAETFMADYKPAEELYDLEKDPHEIHNLAESPDYQEILAHLRTVHRDWVIQTRDLGLLPESEMLARQNTLGNCMAILRQSDGEALLSRLIEAATLAGQPKPDNQSRLIEILNDPDPAVRYWGMIGLGNLPTQPPPPIGPLYDRIQDSSACVRIAAIRGLFRLYRPDTSVTEILPRLEDDRVRSRWMTALLNELDNNCPRVQLSAALEIDEMGAAARPAIESIKKALKQNKDNYVNRVLSHTLDVLRADQKKSQ